MALRRFANHGMSANSLVELCVVLTITLGSATMLSQAPASTSTPARPLITPAQYDRWQTELTNWGRWGKDDQLGALNLITPAKRKQAAGLVKEGITVSLARDVDTEKSSENPQPYEHVMTQAGGIGRASGRGRGEI